MSGHSKWSTIKRKKGAKDAQRSKVWSRQIREITIAARAGGDPNSNSRLRSAILAAQASNMPKDTIERALKRGTGELEGAVYEEIEYEGYGPGGVGILVQVQTDNRNRTVAEIRHCFDRYGGKLGGSGSVAYLFERKGQVMLESARSDMDKTMEVAIDAGAEDVSEEGGEIVIITAPEELHAVAQALQKAGLPVSSAEVARVAQTNIKVTGHDAESLVRLISALDDLDDVAAVSANFDIDDAELRQIQEQL